MLRRPLHMKLWRACISWWVTSPASKLRISPFQVPLQEGVSQMRRGSLLLQQIGGLGRAAELSMSNRGSAEAKPFSLWVFSCTHQAPANARSCCSWQRSQQSWFLGAENRTVLAAADAFAHSSQLSGLPPKKADGQGGTPTICYKAAKSLLCPQLGELSISWHLVGKAGTVPCAKRKPLKKTPNKLAPEKRRSGIKLENKRSWFPPLKELQPQQ